MRRTTMRQIATRQGLALAAALTLVPTAAFAHPGIGEMHGFTHGFAHPLGGLDHMLAMVTVGIFAWQLGGRALWLVPAAFVAAMALGGALAMTGVPMPMVETGIAASVIVLGATVALGIKAPVAIAMSLSACLRSRPAGGSSARSGPAISSRWSRIAPAAARCRCSRPPRRSRQRLRPSHRPARPAFRAGR